MIWKTRPLHVGAPRGPLHGGVADLFYTDVFANSILILVFMAGFKRYALLATQQAALQNEAAKRAEEDSAKAAAVAAEAAARVVAASVKSLLHHNGPS